MFKNLICTIGIFVFGVLYAEILKGLNFKINVYFFAGSNYVSLLSEINSDDQNSLDRLFDQTLQRVNGERFKDDYTILRINFT